MTLLPPKKAAAKLGVSVATFYVWRRTLEGFPPPRVVAGRKLWADADLDAWISALPQEKTA